MQVIHTGEAGKEGRMNERIIVPLDPIATLTVYDQPPVNGGHVVMKIDFYNVTMLRMMLQIITLKGKPLLSPNTRTYYASIICNGEVEYSNAIDISVIDPDFINIPIASMLKSKHRKKSKAK